MLTYAQHFQEQRDFTKGVIIIRKSEKNKQHNGQKKKYTKSMQRFIPTST